MAAGNACLVLCAITGLILKLECCVPSPLHGRFGQVWLDVLKRFAKNYARSSKETSTFFRFVFVFRVMWCSHRRAQAERAAAQAREEAAARAERDSRQDSAQSNLPPDSESDFVLNFANPMVTAYATSAEYNSDMPDSVPDWWNHPAAGSEIGSSVSSGRKRSFSETNNPESDAAISNALNPKRHHQNSALPRWGASSFTEASYGGSGVGGTRLAVGTGLGATGGMSETARWGAPGSSAGFYLGPPGGWWWLDTFCRPILVLIFDGFKGRGLGLV